MKTITFASSTTIVIAFVLLLLALIFDIVWLKWIVGGYLVVIALLLLIPLVFIGFVLWFLSKKLRPVEKKLKHANVIDAKFKVK